MPKKLTVEKFVNRAFELYGNQYDYSKVEFIIDHKLEPNGQPAYVTGKELLKYKQ